MDKEMNEGKFLKKLAAYTFIAYVALNYTSCFGRFGMENVSLSQNKSGIEVILDNEQSCQKNKMYKP